MPNSNEEIELKVIDKENVRYDLKKHIFIKTNLGDVKIDFSDALEITRALLDATYHLNNQTEEILYEIEDQLIS